jgi:DNA-binding response OmpR family regulator
MHKLLLVDDSRAVLAALCSQLDAEVYSVRTALSVEEALALIGQDAPDCILSDYEMPGTDGPGFCRIFKADEKLKHIPVVILTSNHSTDYLLTAIEAGADDFLSKESDIRIIIAKIGAMLRAKKTQDELSRLRHVAGVKQIITTYNHEFNNPLTIAIGNLNYLRREIVDESHLNRLTKAWDALVRMSEIVRKIREIREYVETSYSQNERMIEFKSED